MKKGNKKFYRTEKRKKVANINDKSLMFATLEEKILCDFYDLLVL